MNALNKVLILLLAAMLLAPGCKKKDDDTPAAPTGGTTPTPNVAPDASLRAAVRWSSSLTEQHSGTAWFSAGTNNLVTMTSVTLNGLALTDALIPEFYRIVDGGLDLSGNAAAWAVVGDNGFPSFTSVNDQIVFPLPNEITSSLTVDLSEGYTLSTWGVGNADSVAFTVGIARKVLSGTTYSCHFTAAELALNPIGTGFTASIAGLTYRTEVIGGKRIQFIKERSWEEPVEFVP